MFPASVRGPGVNTCPGDVCLTPPVPVPVPYVNIGQHTLAGVTATTVMFGGMFALHLGSNIVLTSGDEAGVVGGVISGTIIAPGYFVSGSPIVFIEGLPAIRLTSSCSGNNWNAYGVVTAPGIPNVLIAEARPGAGSSLVGDDIDSLLRELAAGTPLESTLWAERVGYVRVDRFRIDTPRVFYNAQRELLAAGAEEMVIDLRGCPGGDLESAYALAADFLPAGATLGHVVDEDGDVSSRAAPRDGPYGYPVTLLVDGGTRSAAEVFAGALAHHGRARLVGERTFGKGTAQRVAATADGGAALATTASLLLPDGSAYEGAGLEPAHLER